MQLILLKLHKLRIPVSLVFWAAQCLWPQCTLLFGEHSYLTVIIFWLTVFSDHTWICFLGSSPYHHHPQQKAHYILSPPCLMGPFCGYAPELLYKEKEPQTVRLERENLRDVF